MSRAQDLASQLASLQAEAIQTVEACDAAAWQRTSAAEGWTAAALAAHFAEALGPINGLVQGIASGAELPPITEEMIDGANAENAVKNAVAPKDQVLSALRQDGERAIAGLRRLSDEQLQRSAQVMGNPLTAEQATQGILIGHLQEHLASFKATIGD